MTRMVKGVVRVTAVLCLTFFCLYGNMAVTAAAEPALASESVVNSDKEAIETAAAANSSDVQGNAVKAVKAEENTKTQHLLREANDPLAPLMSFTIKGLYSPSLYDKSGATNDLQLKAVVPLLPSKSLPFMSIVKLTLAGSTENDNMPSGFGDSQLAWMAILNPKAEKRFAVGLCASFPTAENRYNGTGKYSIGPSIAYHVGTKKMLYGALIQQFNSVAGDANRANVSQTQIQPFVKYFLKDGISIGLSNNNIFTYDWEKKKFTNIPLGININKIVYVDKRPFNVFFDAAYNFANQAGNTQWTFQVGWTMLLPE